MKSKHDKKCVACEKSLFEKQTKFCSSKCKNEIHQSYQRQQERAHSRKRDLIMLKGGKCSVCGYAKNTAALCFHHVDSKKKTMKLDSRTLSNNSWKTILAEAEICILLCHNCHMEHHHPTSLL